ncbi:MAG: hypothetical protein FWE64_02215 [Alphaproteobacteria bacterium]|nr:hypothetical protein [Alphaproteobacteria bacterium]
MKHNLKYDLKKIIAIVAALAVLGIVANRAVQISRENARKVFNVARDVETRGIPVETMRAEIAPGFLREPVAARRGRIYVSGARVRRFSVGQRLSGGGTITSISRNIDLDTGLFLMRTTAPDGNHFAEIPHTGVFVPLYAIHGTTVMIATGGFADARTVDIIARDAERAVVSGIRGGEEIIITRIAPGAKIRVQ